MTYRWIIIIIHTLMFTTTIVRGTGTPAGGLGLTILHSTSLLSQNKRFQTQMNVCALYSNRSSCSWVYSCDFWWNISFLSYQSINLLLYMAGGKTSWGWKVKLPEFWQNKNHFWGFNALIKESILARRMKNLRKIVGPHNFVTKLQWLHKWSALYPYMVKPFLPIMASTRSTIQPCP